MVTLRSTRNCPNTPRVALALEEMGTPYRVERAEDGSFTRDFGVPGPSLLDGALTLVEPNAILRHVARAYGAGTLWPESLAEQAEVDRWLDFQAIRISRAIGGAPDALATLLGPLERHLARQPWMLARGFTVADCGYVPMVQKRARLALDPYPSVVAYLDRLAARPAWARARVASPT